MNSSKLFSKKAIALLKERYFLKNSKGNIVETPEKMFKRVAKAVASADKHFKNRTNLKKTEKEFYNLLSSLDFLPNSPTLMNAGTSKQQLASCFVLPIEDNTESIYTTLKKTAIIHQSGGGTGFSFSELKHPIPIIELFDRSTEIIKKTREHRGANNATLSINHPDIEEFITLKSKHPNKLNNFNLSVAITDKFMKAVEKRPKEKKLFNTIINSIWKCGEPCILFIDTINKENPLPKLRKVKTTSTCGEVPLLEYESCTLGSINLPNMVSKDEIDWKKLKQAIKIAVHFLDNVIEINNYPIKEIETITKQNRKIGLGIMGFADTLKILKIKYDSEQAIHSAKKIMQFIQEQGRITSINLAKQRGSFPNIKKSKYKTMRNATITSLQPTGSTSIIADCSSSIEPILESATKISPTQHIKIQAILQKYTDNSISKTVNMKNNAKKADIAKALKLAHKLGCKGITFYRDKSRSEQVL